MTPGGLRLDRADRIGAALQRRTERGGLLRGADIETADLAAIGTDEAGVEFVAARRGELRRDRPVLLGDEGLDLAFAVADEP